MKGRELPLRNSNKRKIIEGEVDDDAARKRKGVEEEVDNDAARRLISFSWVNVRQQQR